MSYFILDLLNTKVGWTETIFGQYCVIQFTVELGQIRSKKCFSRKKRTEGNIRPDYSDCLKFLLPDGRTKEILILDIRKHPSSLCTLQPLHLKQQQRVSMKIIRAKPKQHFLTHDNSVASVPHKGTWCHWQCAQSLSRRWLPSGSETAWDDMFQK